MKDIMPHFAPLLHSRQHCYKGTQSEVNVDKTMSMRISRNLGTEYKLKRRTKFFIWEVQ